MKIDNLPMLEQLSTEEMAHIKGGAWFLATSGGYKISYRNANTIVGVNDEEEDLSGLL